MDRVTQAHPNTEPLTLAQAKSLKHGDTLYARYATNADGTPSRAKVTSVKTWKTRPNEVLVGWKHGLYTYGHFREYQLEAWTLVDVREQAGQAGQEVSNGQA